MAHPWPRYWPTYGVLAIGVALRVALFIAIPPRLAYDNHFTVIDVMRAEHRIPRPDECWECYQPPLYYLVASAVYSGAEALSSGDQKATNGPARKSVQGISLVAGCLTLFFCLAILRRAYPVDPFAESICLGTIAVLPQHLLMSAMATNDALCYLLATMAVWAAIRVLESWSWRWIVVSALLAGATVLCKGYGWVTIGAVLLILGIQAARIPVRRWRVLAWALIAIALAAGPSIRNRQLYGRWQADNFDFFKNPMINQPPGEISRVEFTTFRLASLIEHPWLHSSQCASYWTNLYGRYWFDFEGLSLTLAVSPEWRAYMKSLPSGSRPPSLADWNRLLDWPAGAVPESLRWPAGASYVAGLPITAAILLGLIFTIVSRRESALWLIAIHLLACLCVPVFQTIRLPIFSAMKAAFTLSAISSVPVMMAICLDRWRGMVARYLVLACLVVLAASNVGLTVWFLRRAG